MTSASTRRLAHPEDEARRAAALRRVAIVLRDLPRPVAAKLLGDLDVDAKQRLLVELESLVDVDPMERKRALESFAGSLRRNSPAESGNTASSGQMSAESYSGSSGDEIILSRSARNPTAQHSVRDPSHRLAGSDSAGNYSSNQSHQPPSEAHSFSNDATVSSPFDCLAQVSDSDVLQMMQHEHPQTVAVVMASIPPARAAKLMPSMGAAQRQDILSRIGRLQSLPEDMIQEIADTFHDRVQQLIAKRNPNPLQELVAAYSRPGETYDPAQASRHVPATAAAVSPRLQAILAEMPDPQSAQPATPTQGSPSHSTQHIHSEATDTAALAADRLRNITRDPNATVGTETGHSETSRLETAPSKTEHIASANVESGSLRIAPGTEKSSRPSSDNGSTSPSTAAFFSTDEVERSLLALSPRDLCQALGRVSTRSAILALCGLPNKTADAAISVLPKSQATQVRQQLAAVGSLELREIDAAKEAVALAARQSLASTSNQDSSQPARMSA